MMAMSSFWNPASTPALPSELLDGLWAPSLVASSRSKHRAPHGGLVVLPARRADSDEGAYTTGGSNMTPLRALALTSLLSGLAVLAWGFVASRGGTPVEPAAFVPFDVPTLTGTAATRSPASLLEATPTATPEPFAGDVVGFRIPRFDVDAQIENLGLIPGQNQLDVPKDPLKVGWYGIYERPGWMGNAVFSAHVDYWPDIRGPFFNLARLEPGDEVVVLMANGQEYRYRVFRKQRYDVTTIPMGDLISAPEKPAGAEWITLITCGGRFRAYLDGDGAGEYLDRDVVVAERVS